MTETKLDPARRVVAAVDASERTLDSLALAKLLGEAVGAPVGIVSVFPYFPLADPSGEELARLRDEAKVILRELAQAGGADPTAVEVIAGNMVARELQAVTERHDTGAVVVGSTHRGPLGGVLPGSVGERLLTGSACPVAVAPRGYASPPPKALELIGVAFDGSAEARDALELGRALARAAGGALRVISVFEPASFGALTTTRTGGASVNSLLRSDLRRALDEAVAERPGSPAVEGRFLEGSAHDVLAAESAQLDLLVTGSRRYGPRVAVLLGGTTHALMRRASCPVFVVPRGSGPAQP